MCMCVLLYHACVYTEDQGILMSLRGGLEGLGNPRVRGFSCWEKGEIRRTEVSSCQGVEINFFVSPLPFRCLAPSCG